MSTPQAPINVHDVSNEHDASLPWQCTSDGTLYLAAFDKTSRFASVNHAGINATYRLEQPGDIAYKCKVQGTCRDGQEAFDHYWHLVGSDGTRRAGEGFLSESEEFSTHRIENLEPGTYQLTLGVFCLGDKGIVLLDLAP